MKGYTGLILVLCLTSAFAMAFRTKRSLDDQLMDLAERLLEALTDNQAGEEAHRREYYGCNWTDKRCPENQKCVVLGPNVRGCVDKEQYVPLH